MHSSGTGTGSESFKQMAKCLNMLRTTGGYQLVNRNPLALCYISHIICGGEHPPNSAVSGKTLCAWGMQAPACEVRQGKAWMESIEARKQHMR